MQSLYERAKADNRRILNTGFRVDMTFTASTASGGQTQTVKGFYTDTNTDIDPATGLQVKGRKIAGQIHASDLTIGSPAVDDDDFKVSFVTVTGDSIFGLVESPEMDRTLGMLSFRVKLITVLPPTPPDPETP